MINGILNNFEISCWMTCIWLKFISKFFLYQNKISQIHPSSFANFSNSHYKSQYQEKFQYIPVDPVHSSAAGHPDKVYHSQLWKDHPKPLLVAETSFNMPVSNAKFDHLFSSMIHENKKQHFTQELHIKQYCEGSTFEDFNPNNAICNRSLG